MAIDADGYILPTIQLEPNSQFGYSGVYFLQSAEGYIKIGKSGNVLKRLATYKTHNFTIRMVGYIWNTEKYIGMEEKWQHELWEPFRISLEWFAPVKPLVSYISLFRKGQGMSLLNYGYDPKTYRDLIKQEREANEYLKKIWAEQHDELIALGWKP